MSKSKETVTIEVPLKWAKIRASKPLMPHQGADPSYVDAACRAALKAARELMGEE